eukprot:GHVN01069846.1.p2 GENE.GHVN01069846.1~~GHVN01069846.1.p2  ORF type:complete len:122 (+),score=20.99 GHVN01069846.1:163-528(+)
MTDENKDGGWGCERDYGGETKGLSPRNRREVNEDAESAAGTSSAVNTSLTVPPTTVTPLEKSLARRHARGEKCEMSTLSAVHLPQNGVLSGDDSQDFLDTIPAGRKFEYLGHTADVIIHAC